MFLVKVNNLVGVNDNAGHGISIFHFRKTINLVDQQVSRDLAGVLRKADAVPTIDPFQTCSLWASPTPTLNAKSSRENCLTSGNNESYFHFCTTTPPRLNSAMSPNTWALSVNSFEGNVVMSA